MTFIVRSDMKLYTVMIQIKVKERFVFMNRLFKTVTREAAFCLVSHSLHLQPVRYHYRFILPQIPINSINPSRTPPGVSVRSLCNCLKH